MAALALLQAAAVAPPAEMPVAATEQGRLLAELKDEDLLFFTVSLDRLTLADTLGAYGDPTDPLLPVGELSRLLDLDLAVMPSERRIIGTLGEDRRAVTVDLDVPLVRFGGRDVPLGAGDVGITAADIFVRARALEALLPARFAIDPEALTIEVGALEVLPVQARRERLGRMQGLARGTESIEDVWAVETPYRLFTPPSIDAVLETATDTRRGGDQKRRYDLRFAGDLLYGNVQGYFGSDDRGDPSTARFLFERRSIAGALPLGATRISAGDVYTPSLAHGPRSVAGRGLSFSTAPLDQASLLNTIDLRGELPIGYDVELYVNDILRSGQRTPVAGRYEFLEVPLASGINVIRIVSYGPRGERTETVRVVNAGGGMLPRGRTVFEAGLVEQERALFEPGHLPGQDSGIGDPGAMRFVASVAHGLSDQLTLVGGVSQYSSLRDEVRRMATTGIRTSLAGYAVQANVAVDHRGGWAVSGGTAGELFGISAFVQHAEYHDGFIDETIVSGEFGRPLLRKSILTADTSLFSGRLRVPFSVRLLRDGFLDGGVAWTGTARTSTSIARTLVSAGFDYQYETRPRAQTFERLTGNLTASRLIDFKWQLRAGADYDLLPDVKLRALVATIDGALSERLSLRLGYGQTFGRSGDGSVQAGLVARLRFADVSLIGDYSVERRDWRIGLRFAFGGLFHPGRRRYVMTPLGVAAGASAALHSFIDADGDGRFGPGDRPAPNVLVEGGLSSAITDRDGRAMITGLGAGPSGRLRVDIKDAENLYLIAPSANLAFASRPGQVLDIPYPLQPAGELQAKIFVRRGAEETGLSALRMQLLREGRPPILATTEFDGSVVFTAVPPGTYRLEIDQDQARRLHARLKQPVTISIAADDAQDVAAEIIFEPGTP